MPLRYPAALASLVAASLLLHQPVAAQNAAPLQPPRTGAVVLIVSSAGVDSGRTRPGFEMDELSQAYLLFKRNGFEVTIASPAGGAVQADRFDRTAVYNADFLADVNAMRLLNNTKRTATLRARDYDALFVVGGKGAMFDLPADTALARVSGEMFDLGAVVSAVCHGPAGLTRARTKDGRFLLAGRAVTGFSNEEEGVFGKKWKPQFSFLLEDEIRKLGARWEEAPLMLPHISVDGRLITGQNPYSTAATVEAVVRTLGRTPAVRTPWADERTVDFASASLRGEPLTARRELAATHKDLQIDLIGLIGYYQLQIATTKEQVHGALTLMELAAPYMPQPEISLGLADAYNRLGRKDEARTLAQGVAKANPKSDEARALLAKIGN